MTRILIDTGALLASVDRNDKYHKQAISYFNTQRDATFYLPDLIFAEILTLTKSRLGNRMAIILGKRLRQSDMFVIEETNHAACWKIFERYDDKAWSYADCSLLELGRRHNIATVFGFDHHLDQMAELTRQPQ